ncbi:hypothetical protein AVMA1855_20040 [Acidovorax sp. SUPP1855]|uniref:hypothetical protein n=1 Tax=Acidovorax sp. SUPP1855 TaxID=431774 RepID=UPI0023DE3BBA|nr:hypothetical protein [Acidovorax sp. SUPP1855]GKS86482.1 hypothetical protein AVMA1855_20040 [Acidovorax sp. SUPP1855]
MSVGTIMGNTLALGVAEITLTPASVAAATTAEQTFRLPGIRLRDAIAGVSRTGTPQAGLGIVNARVVSDDTIGVTFANTTAGALTPTAGEIYKVTWLRPDAVQTGTSV